MHIGTGELTPIGDLARDTGITVRTLRHYDHVGLLSPSSRTAGGHRCYTPGDIRRLHRIVALRSFGLSLDEIGAALDDDPGETPHEVVRRQLDAVDERIRRAERLRSRLLGVLGVLDAMGEPSTTQFLQMIEETMTMDEPFTPRQVREMTARRQEMLAQLTGAEVAEMQRRRADAAASLGDEERARLEARHRLALARVTDSS